MQAKVLFFDVGGTIFDWKSTAISKAAAISGLVQDSSELTLFVDSWRRCFFSEREKVATGELPWMNSDSMQVQALKNLAADHSFISDISDLDAFSSSVWHALSVFDGAPESLHRLRKKHTTIVLSILSWKSIVRSSKLANVSWDGVLSCEFLGYYKPSFQAYFRACELAGCAPEDAMMVAAHDADLAAAKQCGLQTARIKMSQEDEIFKVNYDSKDAFNFDLYATDFEDLCKQLNC